MPMYDFKCDAGHRHEAFANVSRYHLPRICPDCGSLARRIDFLTAPAFNFAGSSEDRATYAQHNITFTGERGDGEQTIGFTPNSHEDQCQCESCKKHRRTHLVTEVADKGKDVAICP